MSSAAHDFGECTSPCPYCEADAAACRICGDPRPDGPLHRDVDIPKGRGPFHDIPPHRYVAMSEPSREPGEER